MCRKYLKLYPVLPVCYRHRFKSRLYLSRLFPHPFLNTLINYVILLFDTCLVLTSIFVFKIFGGVLWLLGVSTVRQVVRFIERPAIEKE